MLWIDVSATTDCSFERKKLGPESLLAQRTVLFSIAGHQEVKRCTEMGKFSKDIQTVFQAVVQVGSTLPDVLPLYKSHRI